jgi:predicted dienelactone hydrolase
MLVMYPTNTAANPVAFGPFSLEVTMEAPVADGRFPVVMISHGSGGSNLTHQTLGMHLAQSGFVVCMPEHRLIIATASLKTPGIILFSAPFRKR